ncbi:uncharacterized protein LOC119686085 [Teleopsis dalmanni]|uniref:uncharacterized protein LOC119686085 n=1 Tax=Teleopsis dalmanni TaxID=139649 RepID=UPI0018CF65AF|nr:uncharacterized protein LOC119686085 [Teleopsis dalmanni]
MDILDIDEVLKDDSFIFLDDKSHDDVSNILRQWKNNNCIPTQLQQQQQNQEQVYKLNSRTFTRPKRKSAQNLESQFSNSPLTNGLHMNQHQSQHGSPMLNLEIGGLVTTMHKSFLQDTSPPSSICSSMDVSVDRMNNSLITSADFSNLSFLQSTQSLDLEDVNRFAFNFSNKATSDGYTLSDMIRDRKALESLTMSSDGTLIKDSHIAQIDDISLTFSKTASGSSTMDNSTESMDCNNRTVQIFNKDDTFNGGKANSDNNSNENIIHRTMLLNNDLISDTTFNLIENSLHGEQIAGQNSDPNVTHNLNNVKQQINETFKKPTTLNETVCVIGNSNTTFECQQSNSDPLCETPESVRKSVGTMKIYESTPRTTNIRYNRHQYTPTLQEMTEDVNISPIIATLDQRTAIRAMNETFEREPLVSKINSNTFNDVLPKLDSMEMIENIQNPNITFQKSFETDFKSAAGKEMKNVMDLAKAEAELLAGNDEEFEHKLDEFSKIEMNMQQLKMKKSLESIKKRFSCVTAPDNKCEKEIIYEDMDKSVPPGYVINTNKTFETDIESPEKYREYKDTTHVINESNSPTNSTKYIRNSMFVSKELRDSSGSGLTSSTASASSNAGERLLSRRSRLYDDFNFSVLNSSKTQSTSFAVHKPEPDIDAENHNVIETESRTNMEKMIHEKTEENLIAEPEKYHNAQDLNTATYKLSEKRSRDRDRFKTIKIVKSHNVNSENYAPETELNVPCIDDDIETKEDLEMELTAETQEISQRFSRRDNTHSNNNNKIETEEASKTNSSKINPKFLTYKKPKEKSTTTTELPEVCPTNEDQSASADVLKPAKSRLEPRSLSRPRYISGLQKFSVVSKATSAGNLDNTTGASATTAPQKSLAYNSRKSALIIGVGVNQQVKTSSNIKSPMGIKSKSFHNLSNNFGYTNAENGAQTSKTTFGLKKNVLTENQVKSNGRNSTASANKLTAQAASLKSQKNDESVFKVPKLVSGIRVPGAAGAKRSTMVRPSSGYYSLNVTTKPLAQPTDLDIDTGRHSPTDLLLRTYNNPNSLTAVFYTNDNE